MQPLTGRCLCGDVRFEVSAKPRMVVYCHCASCRRQTASPVAAFLIVDAAAARFTAGAPAEYRSSPPVRRSFCPRRGTPIAYRTDARAEMVDIFAGALDEPGAIAPGAHVHAAGQLAWFEVHDALPRYATGSTREAPMRHGPAA
jgi:hypothetical protein